MEVKEKMKARLVSQLVIRDVLNDLKASAEEAKNNKVGFQKWKVRMLNTWESKKVKEVRERMINKASYLYQEKAKKGLVK